MLKRRFIFKRYNDRVSISISGQRTNVIKRGRSISMFFSAIHKSMHFNREMFLSRNNSRRFFSDKSRKNSNLEGNSLLDCLRENEGFISGDATSSFSEAVLAVFLASTASAVNVKMVSNKAFLLRGFLCRCLMDCLMMNAVEFFGRDRWCWSDGCCCCAVLEV